MGSPVKNNDGVQSYFQIWANRFDGLYELEKQSIFWNAFNRIFRKAIFERVDLTFRAIGDLQNKTVLDIGCGSGRQLIYAVNQGAVKATGIDFSEDMLEIAQSAAAKAGVEEKIEFIEGDFNKHTFTDQFNAVYALGVFDYVSDPVKMLAKMRELASETVIASFPLPSLIRMPLRKVRYAMRGCPVYSYRQDQLHKIAKQAGFENYKIDHFASCGLILYGFKANA